MAITQTHYSQISGKIIDVVDYMTDAQKTGAACTITGMPAEIRPARQNVAFIRIKDNSLDVLGGATVDPSGTITLGVGETLTTFTAAGGAESATITLNEIASGIL